jgi:hypothetical protein
MPHAQLLPLLPALAKGDGSPNADYPRLDAYRFWCEDSPDDCRAAILSEVRESNGQTSKIITLLLPESEQPEFDAKLASRLPESGAAQDSAEAQRIASLVLRIGSRKLAPSVESVLQKLDQQEGCAAWTESYLLGYQFRFDQKKAEKRLASALWNRKDYCGSQILRTLHEVRYSDNLLPIAVKALNAPNLLSAQTAALFLGQHGSPSSESLLWQRLESFWASWKGRAMELNEAPMDPRNNDRTNGANLEQALASALAHAQNWKLDSAAIDRLRSGCLTEACRDIASGQRSLGL